MKYLHDNIISLLWLEGSVLSASLESYKELRNCNKQGRIYMNCLPTASPQNLLGTSAGNTQFPGSILSSSLIILSCWRPYWDNQSEIFICFKEIWFRPGSHDMACEEMAGKESKHLPLWRAPLEYCANSKWKHWRNMHKYCGTLPLQFLSSPFYFVVLKQNITCGKHWPITFLAAHF